MRVIVTDCNGVQRFDVRFDNLKEVRLDRVSGTIAIDPQTWDKVLTIKADVGGFPYGAPFQPYYESVDSDRVILDVWNPELGHAGPHYSGGTPEHPKRILQ